MFQEKDNKVFLCGSEDPSHEFPGAVCTVVRSNTVKADCGIESPP